MPRKPPQILFEREFRYDPDTNEVLEIVFRVAEKIIWHARLNGRAYGVQKVKRKGVTIMVVPPWHEDNGRIVKNMDIATKLLARYMKWVSAELYMLAEQNKLASTFSDDIQDGIMKE